MESTAQNAQPILDPDTAAEPLASEAEARKIEIALNTLPPTMVWASAAAIRERIADVPVHWLGRFVLNHPRSCRKFAHAKNGKLLFRVADVLAAIEAREDIAI